MNSKKIFLAGGLSVVAAAVLAFGALWYFVLDTDAEPPVSLEGATASLATPQTGSPAAPAAAIDSGDLTGEWSLAADGTSFAGYRIDQQVSGIGSQTVVGRTPSVQASFNFDGSSINDLTATADLTALKSDESLRDRTLRSEAIETDAFPTATFTLSQPIAVSSIPAEGERVSQVVAGELTLHGVTRPIETNVEAVLQDGRFIVIASNEIQLADFGISPPRGPASVLSVEDHGIMEVQLIFEKGAQGAGMQTPPTPMPSPDAGANDPY